MIEREQLIFDSLSRSSSNSSSSFRSLSFSLLSAMIYTFVVFGQRSRSLVPTFSINSDHADGEMIRLFLQNSSSARVQCVRLLQTFPVMVSYKAALRKLYFFLFSIQSKSNLYEFRRSKYCTTLIQSSVHQNGGFHLHNNVFIFAQPVTSLVWLSHFSIFGF